MKILYVITRSDVMGGASVHLLDLVEGMSTRGHHTEVLVGGEGIFVEKCRDRGIRVTSLNNLVRPVNPLKDLLCFFELFNKLKRSRPDIVHLHSSKAGILGRMVCKLLGFPCVFTAHGWAFTEGVARNKRYAYTFIEKLMAPLAKKIIAVSDYDKKLALNCGVSNESQLITIHNGVKSFHDKESLKPTGLVQLVMVARFDAPKDQELLIKAMAMVKSPNWALTFVGDGPNLNSCISLAQKLDLSKQLKFVGHSDNIAEHVNSSHIFILLSHWEGLPLTILEAMSAALPIIASNVGGVAETFDPSCGILVDNNDISSIASEIDNLIINTNLRNKMSRASLLRYEEKFSSEMMLSKTELIYMEVCIK